MKNNKLFFTSILIIVALIFACAFSVLAEPDDTASPTPTTEVTESPTAEVTESPSPTPDNETPTPTADGEETPSPTPSGETPSPTPTNEIVENTPTPTISNVVTQAPPERTKDPYVNNDKVTNAPPTIPPDAQDEIDDIVIATPFPDDNNAPKKSMNSKTMLIILFAVLFVLLALDILAIYLRGNWLASKKSSFTRKAKDYYDDADNAPNEFDLPILEDEPKKEDEKQIDIFDGFDFTENESDENG